MTNVLIRHRVEKTKSQERPREAAAELGLPSMPAKERPKRAGPGESREAVSPTPFAGKDSSACAFILDFWPPENYERYISVVFKPLSLW